MSATNVIKAVGPRQVVCETSDSDQVPVKLDFLRVSGTFKRMYDDLGLEEHDEFPGVFSVKTVSTRIFKRVIGWCRMHKDAPELVVEKDPLTQEVKWFTLTESERRFFDVPALELLELIMAADYLDIPRLYHYACQSIAAWMKGKHPLEICKALRQDCDLSRVRIWKFRMDNPWIASVFPGARIKNSVFIPNEVLVTIFEKLPREDLERLQLVSAQFDDLIVSSVELSEVQGPLRVITKVEFGASSRGRFSQRFNVWLADGTMVTCPDYKNLARRLKCGKVQTLRVGYYANVQDLSELLPVKSAWKDAIVEACFPCRALFEFAFTQLLFCKEIVLGGEGPSMSWSRPYMRLPDIMACNKLDISGLDLYEDRIHPADVVEWLEREAPTEKKWSEARQLILHEDGLLGDIETGLLTALKTALSASSRLTPYIVRIRHRRFHWGNLNEELANETTHERLSIRTGRNHEVIVKRA